MRLDPYKLNPAPPREVAARLREALRRRRGFSLIRVGEGEATFLLPPEQSSIGAVARRLEYYFGHCDISFADWSALCRALRRSLTHADVLCPPEPGQWRIRSRAGDGFAQRYRQLAECLSTLEFPEMPLVAGAYVNYALHADGTLFDLLEAEKEIGLISSQPAAPLLRALFGLRVREFPVPQRAVDNESLTGTGHFPDRFTELCAALRRDVAGLLVLVGAGPLGKIYCDVIRQAGGIALDLGSLLDAWTGLCSRADHNSLEACNAPGVPGYFPEGVHEDLLLTPRTVTRLTGGRLDKSHLRLPPVESRMSPFFTRKSAQAIVSLRLLETSGLFDAGWYLERYARGQAVVIPPLEHYVRFGANRGYWPNPHFDTAWYRERRMKPAERDINPLLHYLLWGAEQGFSTSEPAGGDA